MRKRNLHSVIVNSVHDSLVVDTHENEENEVLSAIQEAEQNLREEFFIKFQVDLDVPLSIECKMGPNWMDVA
jgi:DNA polymerase I-like protein with 3'-5' exonuclease and polymerase domains